MPQVCTRSADANLGPTVAPASGSCAKAPIERPLESRRDAGATQSDSRVDHVSQFSKRGIPRLCCSWVGILDKRWCAPHLGSAGIGNVAFPADQRKEAAVPFKPSGS